MFAQISSIGLRSQFYGGALYGHIRRGIVGVAYGGRVEFKAAQMPQSESTHRASIKCATLTDGTAAAAGADGSDGDLISVRAAVNDPRTSGSDAAESSTDYINISTWIKQDRLTCFVSRIVIIINSSSSQFLCTFCSSQF
jgi:hypothetical protein